MTAELRLLTMYRGDDDSKGRRETQAMNRIGGSFECVSSETGQRYQSLDLVVG